MPRGANHWPVLAQRPAHRPPLRLTREEERAARHAQIWAEEAKVTDAWSTGVWLADCRECLDIPRRFGTEAARNLWADEHISMTLHRVGVGRDMKGYTL